MSVSVFAYFPDVLQRPLKVEIKKKCHSSFVSKQDISSQSNCDFKIQLGCLLCLSKCELEHTLLVFTLLVQV